MKKTTSQLTLFGDTDQQSAPIEERKAPVVQRRVPARAARRKLEEQLCERMPAECAAAIGRIVVDPEKARKRLHAPTAHHLQGGTLYTIDVEVFSAGVLPFPANPRTVGTRRYPAAGDAVAETPVPAEVYATKSEDDTEPPAIDIRVDDAVSLARLASANAQSILAMNNLVDSIAHQGILNPVLGVVARVVLSDGTSTWVVVAADGSSRITAAQRILDMSPSQALYPFAEEIQQGVATQFERYVQGVLREVDQIQGKTARTQSVAVLESRQRALVSPMTVVVGWEPAREEPADVLALVRSKLGLTHVSGAKQWELASQYDAVADSALDAIARSSLIDSVQYRWLTGHMSSADAALHGLPYLADERFVAVCATILDEEKKRVVNSGIRNVFPTGTRSHSDRIAVAVEVSLRQSRSVLEPDSLSKARVTLIDVCNVSVFTRPEQIDGRRRNKRLANIMGEGETLEELLEIALAEIELTENLARRRLMLLALWWMATGGLLERIDGRSAKNPVRPGPLMNTMASSRQGLLVLHRIVEDCRAGRPPRLVDEKGQIVSDENGAEVLVTAGLLREIYAEKPASSSLSESIDESLLPADQMRHHMDHAVGRLRSAEEAVTAVFSIVGDDSEPLFERFGLELAVLEDGIASAQRTIGRLTEVAVATKRLIRKNRSSIEDGLATPVSAS